MEYKKLPGTELTVSRACLGTMTFGDRLDAAAAAEAVAFAVEQGINFVDTADIYPRFHTETAERILGEAMKPWRDKLVVATKAGGETGPGPDGRGLGKKHLTAALEGSLRRLQTDCIDLYYAHFPDRDVSPAELAETMNGFIRAGKIRHYGVSNFSAWQLCELVLTARSMGLEPPVATESVYNLVTRGVEGELLPFLEKYGMGLVVYNPLAGGLLTGKYLPGEAGNSQGRLSRDAEYGRRYGSAENRLAAERLGALAAGRGQTLLALALQWLCAREAVTSVILGFSSFGQLREDLEAINQTPPAPLPEAELQEIWEALSGGRFAYYR